MEIMAVLYRAAGIEIVWPELPVLVSHRDRVFHGIAAALPKSAADAVASSFGPQLLNLHKEPASSFRVLNRGFAWLTLRYTGVVEFFLKRTFISVVLVAAMLGATGYLFTKVQAVSYRRKTKVMC